MLRRGRCRSPSERRSHPVQTETTITNGNNSSNRKTTTSTAEAVDARLPGGRGAAHPGGRSRSARCPEVPRRGSLCAPSRQRSRVRQRHSGDLRLLRASVPRRRRDPDRGHGAKLSTQLERDGGIPAAPGAPLPPAFGSRVPPPPTSSSPRRRGGGERRSRAPPAQTAPGGGSGASWLRGMGWGGQKKAKGGKGREEGCRPPASEPAMRVPGCERAAGKGEGGEGGGEGRKGEEEGEAAPAPPWGGRGAGAEAARPRKGLPARPAWGAVTAVPPARTPGRSRQRCRVGPRRSRAPHPGPARGGRGGKGGPVFNSMHRRFRHDGKINLSN